MKKLNDFCAESGGFVGIRAENGEPRILFPAGYFKKGELPSIPEETLRREAFNLLKILGTAAQSDSPLLSREDIKIQADFPLTAYVELLEDYIDRGLYREVETSHKTNASGKIDWNRTFKRHSPLFSKTPDGSGNFICTDFVASRKSYEKSRIITQIHRFCIREAIQKIGFLFGMGESPECPLEFDESLFRTTLQAKFGATFQERLLRLFGNMLKVVDHLSGKKSEENGNPSDFVFGVEKFWPVWQWMLDSLFGNLESGEDKRDFQPHCRWNVNGKPFGGEIPGYTMQPDTIMRLHNDGKPEIFILDAKFYPENLPASDSIAKQIIYGDFVEKNSQKFGVESDRIYNAFLLPTSERTAKTPYGMEFFGYANGNWKGLERPYHKIVGIRLDVRSVIESNSPNFHAQSELANLIRRNSR